MGKGGGGAGLLPDSNLATWQRSNSPRTRCTLAQRLLLRSAALATERRGVRHSKVVVSCCCRGRTPPRSGAAKQSTGSSSTLAFAVSLTLRVTDVR